MTEKVRKTLVVPIYILVDEDALVLPSAKVEIVRPSQLPTEGNYYVLTASGLHVNRDTNVAKALTPVKTLPVLAEFEQAAKLRLPKLPPIILARAHALFSRVWKKHHAESEVMLLFNSNKKMYDLWCPTQNVSGASVNYTMSAELLKAVERKTYEYSDDDWQWVGTIHSHCNFSAYHSATDENDEIDMDGIHITLGHVDQNEPSMAATVCIGKKRWPLPVENVCLGVERQTTRTGYFVTTSRDEHFEIQLSPEETAAMSGPLLRQVIDEWLPRISPSYWNPQNTSSVWTVRDIEESDEDGEWVLKDGLWTFLTTQEVDFRHAASAVSGDIEPERDANCPDKKELTPEVTQQLLTPETPEAEIPVLEELTTEPTQAQTRLRFPARSEEAGGQDETER